MSDLALRCQDITKNYGEKAALSGLNIEIPKNKIVGILGPNGSIGAWAILIIVMFSISLRV